MTNSGKNVFFTNIDQDKFPLLAQNIRLLLLGNSYTRVHDVLFLYSKCNKSLIFTLTVVFFTVISYGFEEISTVILNGTPC